MNRKLTDLLMIALAVIAFIAGCNWEKRGTKDPEIVKGTPDTVQVIVHVRDTIIKPVATSARAYRPAKKNTVNEQARPTPDDLLIGDVVADTGALPSDCDSIREYTTFSRDSMVKVSTEVHGAMLSQVIEAEIRNTTITRVDTMTRAPRFSIYGGLAVGYNFICPGITLVRPKSSIGAGYDLIGKLPVINYGIRLYSSKR